MTQEFRKFLKDRNAYENYIGNNKGESDNPYEYFDGFHWDSSKEGYEYWSDLDSEWFDYLEWFEYSDKKERDYLLKLNLENTFKRRYI